MSRVGADAPGKLMICGEYAVLEGAPAIVAAVGARGAVRWVPAGSYEAEWPTPEVDAARALAEEALGPVPMDHAVDVMALRKGGRKLGLGSSAAGVAAAAGAVFAYHGHDLDDAATIDRVLEAAFRGHHAVSPNGSGADVAAAVLGGFVRFVRHGDDYEARRLPWPPGLVARVVWTGKEARTSDFIEKVRGLATRTPHRHRTLMDDLRDRADEFVGAFERGDAAAVVKAAGRYGDAMAALGEAADAPIVEAELRRIADLAQAHGGAAKPSGAGGGDVGVAFFPNDDAALAFDAACAEAGLDVLDIELGAPGVGALKGARCKTEADS